MSYSNYQICHFWANGVAPKYGRNSWGRSFPNNNVYYNEDGRIYSYGPHFCMGRIVNGVLFYTKQGYSNSTAKHKGYMHSAWRGHGASVACAIQGKRGSGYYSSYSYVFEPESEQFREANFEAWANDLADLCKGLVRARKPAKWIAQIDGICAEVRAFCVACGCDVPAFVAEYENGVTPEIRNRAREIAEADRAREAEQRRKRAEAERIKEAENVERFEAGEINYYSSDFQRVRYNAESERFETSKGVQIPLEIGRRFYEALKAGTLKEGQSVLYYKILSIGKNLQIGCHKFSTEYLLQYGSKFFATI